MKHCYKCNSTKSLESFGKNKSKRDGLASECRDCKRKIDREHYSNNTEKLKQKYLEYYYSNKEEVLSKNRKYFKKYNKLHRDKLNAKEAARRASKLNATPLWANKEIIAAKYAIAKWLSFTCFQEYHVDHIIPLKNSKVCGLHCEDNLQVIPATTNLQKSNKYVCT